MNFEWNEATHFAYKWNTVAFIIFVSYVPVILFLNKIMKNFNAIELDFYLMLWNFLMSKLSFLGFFILFPYLIKQSFINTITSLDYSSNYTGLVVFYFNLSKIPEMIDTLFIVLRKKKLTFLHTFHHLMTAIYCWITFIYPTSLGLWYTTMNLFVHGIMYGYYALNYFGYKFIPPILLTTIQIIQMYWGLVINLINLTLQDNFDFSTILNSVYGITMYGSYLYLFCNFFSNRYKFKTEVNWPMCFYLLSTHLAAIIGLLKIKSFYTLFEVFIWYQICGWGVTVGMHRLWSHRSFKAKTPTKILLMILASMSNQGSIYHWCRDHRTHHKNSDSEGDPHDITRGFFYSHMGWLMLKKDKAVIDAGKKLNCEDLLNEWVIKLNYQLNPLWNQFWCFIIPGLYGLWRFNSFWDGLLIFGALRWVLELHATWCVNSVAHTFGYKPYKNIPPSESLITSLLSNGEGWHNWHHTYPYDYAASEDSYFINHSTLFIDFLWFIGQTYDHKRHVLKKKE